MHVNETLNVHKIKVKRGYNFVRPGEPGEVFREGCLERKGVRSDTKKMVSKDPGQMLWCGIILAIELS